MNRRNFNIFAASAGALHMAGASAQSREPLKIVVPWNPGGVTDLLSRCLAEQMAPSINRPVVVENRIGAAGMVGTSYVAHAPADGNVVCIATPSTLGLNKLLYRKMPYEPMRDFAMISLAASLPSILVVSSRFPARTMPELVKLLKANPDKYTYASSGAGSVSHLGMEAIAATLGTRVRHIPYSSSTPGLAAILAGDVDMALHPAGTVTAFVAEGSLRALAVSSKKRSTLFPDLPTLEEGGAPGVHFDSWLGYVAPAGTPRGRIDEINRQMAMALSQPKAIEFLKSQSMEPMVSTPEEMAAAVASDVALWKPIVERLNIKLDA